MKEAIENNILGLNISPQRVLDTFKAIENDIKDTDLPAATLAVPLYGIEDKLEAGDWAAELHFILRRVCNE